MAALFSRAAAAETRPLATFRTKSATFAVNGQGALCELKMRKDGRNYLAVNQPAPLLSVKFDGKLHAPDTASWDAPTKRLVLGYPGTDLSVVLGIRSRPTHIVLEVLNVRTTNHVQLVLWGPYPTTIGDIIGETVGVVRDPEIAIGIQALNPKTLGGYPSSPNDIQAGYTADDHGRYPDLPSQLNKDQLFRGNTARATAFGSVLQAYCRNRDRNRIIPNWGFPKYLAPAYSDGGVAGSAIALFACPADQALDTIGAIEVAEHLPHPMLDGLWAKEAPEANCSYLIVGFGEKTIDRAIAMAKRAGLKYIYLGSAFETWGHFKLKPSLFPHGWAGLRTCVQKARRAGLRVGFHTLSNFITPNDGYVTPRPDPRLARVGSSILSNPINATQKVIPVAAPDYFRKKTTLNTVMIDEELIRYGSVSTKPPWHLLDCRRGAWGTLAAAHAPGATVAKLMDHPYRVFLGDATLSQEMARDIAALCNATGVRQLSFDGLEGNWSTGMGQYGRALFTKAWYDALSPALRGRIINDASNPGHFNWHIYTRMNWGEPWHAGFRQSQTLYRFKNQVYFERNLMPRMLGWFALGPETSLADAEWLLARAAGYNAGFALVAPLASRDQLALDPVSVGAAGPFGALPGILQAVRQWETARMAHAFPPRVRAALRDNSREFHLAPAGPGTWSLYEVHTARFTRDFGENATSVFHFRNHQAAQPLQWVIHSAAKQPVRDLAVEIDGAEVLRLPHQNLLPGDNLLYSGGSEAVLCDASWKERARIPVNATAARIDRGAQALKVSCSAPRTGQLKIELRTIGPATRIHAAAHRSPSTKAPNR